ncbi:hypothetical protein BC943DRAFT_317862 [Umbelopsis sp. AD052]|nr:hypothetical protein BC943DRAFT_317862 [Umbelopsis sp. AD052]
MSRNEDQPQLVNSLTISPAALHNLVEQMQTLQMRLEHLERQKTISDTQSLVEITAAYDISPIPSRLSIANAISKVDLKKSLIKTRSLIKTGKFTVNHQRKKQLETTLDADEITLIDEENEGTDLQPILQQNIIPIEQMRGDMVSTSDNSSVETSTSCSDTTETVSGCRTPSLVLSGSMDTVSSTDTPSTSQMLHVFPRISSLEHYDTSLQSLVIESPLSVDQDEPSTAGAHTRQLTSVSAIAIENSPASQMPENNSLHTGQIPTYGRCYSSFFPTTLVPPSPSFAGSTGRLSLATSMRELRPGFEQSASCLNLLDHVEISPNGSSIGFSAMTSTNSTLNLPQPKKLNRAKRWLTKKLAVSPKLKSSTSAPVLRTHKQPSLLSRKWSKLVGRV